MYNVIVDEVNQEVNLLELAVCGYTSQTII